MKVETELLQGHDEYSGSLSRKRLSLSKVNAETRVQIVKMAATKTRTHREIGKLFNVRQSTVAKLASALKRSKSTIVKCRVKELIRSRNQEAIISVVRRMIKEKQSIWSMKLIQGLVKEESNRVVPSLLI